MPGPDTLTRADPSTEPAPRLQRGHARASERPEMLRLRGRMGLGPFLGVAAAVFAALFILWIAATANRWVDPLFLPEPSSVWHRLRALSADGTLWADMRVSAYRILVGFLIASVVAVPLGVLMGMYRVWEAALEPLVDFIRYMPVVAFVPLSIIWIGTDDSQKFLIIFIGTFFQQVLMVMDSVKRIPQDFIDIGRTLGLPERRILRRIVLPGSAPAIWDAMRITLGWAWTYLTLAELVAASSGLGYRITVGQRFFQTDLIIGYILVLGVLGLLTDQIMKLVGRRLFGWAEATR